MHKRLTSHVLWWSYVLSMQRNRIFSSCWLVHQHETIVFVVRCCLWLSVCTRKYNNCQGAFHLCCHGFHTYFFRMCTAQNQQPSRVVNMHLRSEVEGKRKESQILSLFPCVSQLLFSEEFESCVLYKVNNHFFKSCKQVIKKWSWGNFKEKNLRI